MIYNCYVANSEHQQKNRFAEIFMNILLLQILINDKGFTFRSLHFIYFHILQQTKNSLSIVFPFI